MLVRWHCLYHLKYFQCFVLWQFLNGEVAVDEEVVAQINPFISKEADIGAMGMVHGLYFHPLPIYFYNFTWSGQAHNKKITIQTL